MATRLPVTPMAERLPGVDGTSRQDKGSAGWISQYSQNVEKSLNTEGFAPRQFGFPAVISRSEKLSSSSGIGVGRRHIRRRVMPSSEWKYITPRWWSIWSSPVKVEVSLFMTLNLSFDVGSYADEEKAKANEEVGYGVTETEAEGFHL